MKPRVYLIVLLLIVPVQASLFGPVSVGGIKPDLSLALIYLIGLLTSPTEASIAGIALGLVQDIGSAGLIGMNAFTRGLVGLGAGFLGRRVLDMASFSNGLFLAAFSLLEGLVIFMFLNILYGDVPFTGIFLSSMLPQALATVLLGLLMLRFFSRKNNANMLLRRSLQKE